MAVMAHRRGADGPFRAADLTPGQAALLGSAVLAILLPEIVSWLDLDLAAVQPHLIASFRLIGAALFLVAGVLNLSRGKLEGSGASVRLGAALVILGGVALSLPVLVTSLAPVAEQGSLEPMVRFVGVTTAVGLLVISLQTDVGNLDTAYTARLTRRLLVAVMTGVCLAGVLATVVTLPPTLGTGPWLERGVGVWLAACWFATAALAVRRAHTVAWAQRMWPVLLTLGCALVMRVSGSYGAPELLIGSALLVMVAGAVTFHDALDGIHSALHSAHEVAVVASSQFEQASRGLADQVEWRSALRHEAVNSIAGIRAALDLISTPHQHAPTIGLLEATITEVGHLEHLVLREQSLTPVPFKVADVVDSTVTARRAMGLQVHVVPGAEEAEGIPDDLATVLHNLLINAHLHGGGDTVQVSSARVGDFVEIEVSDRGPGVPRQARSRIFEPGVRASAAPGTGLGLHISRTLLREQGGDLVLRETGTGASFVARVPAQRSLSTR